MSEKISCRNVIKIKFDGTAKELKDGGAKDVPAAPAEAELPAVFSRPPLHPSISEENLSWRHIDTSDSSIVVASPSSPLRSSSSRPPRAKQLQSVKLLVDQHNKHSCDECHFMFLIDAEWLNAWYRCVILNDTSLYPGPINNWNLIATPAGDGTLANGTSSNSSLTLAVTAPAVTTIFNRASQLRGLSFDGVECDFAEELEQYQEKQSKSPLKEALAHSSSASGKRDGNGNETQLAVDYDYMTCQFPIKRELREDLDFYLLPQEAWQALHGWYGGGPPLPRHLHNSLQYRASVPCAVGELLLQHPPVVGCAPQDQDGTNNVRCDGFAEGAAMHDLDLHPASADQLPCMQDTLRQPQYTPTSAYSTLHSGGGGGLHRSFSSMNSLNHSLSTMSFPSMNDLTSLSDAASVSAAAGTGTMQATEGDAASLESNRSRSSPVPGSSAPSAVAEGAVRTAVPARPASSGATSSRQFCHVCQRRAVTRCSKCSSIFYCSRDCQGLHWKYHKTLCAKLAKRKQLQVTMFLVFHFSVCNVFGSFRQVLRGCANIVCFLPFVAPVFHLVGGERRCGSSLCGRRQHRRGSSTRGARPRRQGGPG